MAMFSLSNEISRLQLKNLVQRLNLVFLFIHEFEILDLCRQYYENPSKTYPPG